MSEIKEEYVGREKNLDETKRFIEGFPEGAGPGEQTSVLREIRDTDVYYYPNNGGAERFSEEALRWVREQLEES